MRARLLDRLGLRRRVDERPRIGTGGGADSRTRRRAAGGDRKALVARGYTERGLFGLLKTGFDVMSVAHSSRFFVELVRLREYKLMRAGADDETICLDVGWRYRLAEQLDFFNFWSKGFVITVYARRRQWRERTAPVLADGRTIHEAVLTR